MKQSLPKDPTLLPAAESGCDVSTDDLSSLARTAEFDAPEMPSRPGVDEHARYQVLERLGGGGFGVVFKAWDAELERTVAIKLLRPGAGASSAAALLTEART